MFVLVVGCGRVGSKVALEMMAAGHDVSVLDESPESHDKLDYGLQHDYNKDSGSTPEWEDFGRFTVGTALEVDALEEAGIEEADVVICSTDGDNTNIVVAQIARERYKVLKVIARVLDPLRAEWYRDRGLETVCPTQIAIDLLLDAAREPAARQGGSDGSAAAGNGIPPASGAGTQTEAGG
jgi:trk system potassium uptake protein